MRIKAYFSTSTFLFLVIAFGHFVRAINQTKVTIGTWQVPVGLSWVAVLVAGYMAYQSYKLRSTK